MKTIPLALALLLAAGAPSVLAVITLTASDSGSSFDTSGNWSDGLAPHGTGDSDYLDAQYTLRTPATTSALTFGGSSLTIGNGTSANASILIKSFGVVLTINNLTLNKATIGSGNGYSSNTIAGTMQLLNSDTFTVSSGSFRVTSDISGTGSLTLASSVATNSLTLGGANSYSGGTTVSGGILDVTGATSLGTGSVSVASGATLKLEIAGIDDGSALVLAAGASALLSFTGSDTVGSLSLDGGATLAAAGTYGAIGSGAQFESALLSGSGFLDVVPEPASWALLLAGACGACLAARRRAAA